jgi:hypothetical protein
VSKLPLQSKKFVAFLISEITWKVIVFVCVWNLVGEDAPLTGMHSIIMASVVIAGFIEAGYIGGQAWLDKYVRVAEITTKGSNEAPTNQTGE